MARCNAFLLFFPQNGVGEVNPDAREYVDCAATLRGYGDPVLCDLSVVNLSCVDSPHCSGSQLNPGVKFGYWGSKEYFMKNLGSVKDYRTARQLLLDAESAM